MTQKEADQYNEDESFQEWNKMSLEDRMDSSFSDYSLGYYQCKQKMANMVDEITAEKFIKERYDWSSEDLDRWRELLSKLPMADYSNVLDLMIEFSKENLR